MPQISPFSWLLVYLLSFLCFLLFCIICWSFFIFMSGNKETLLLEFYNNENMEMSLMEL